MSGFSSSAPLTDATRRCSRKTPGGIGFLPDPSFDSISAAALSSLGMYLTSYPRKHLANLINFVSVGLHDGILGLPGSGHLLCHQVGISTAYEVLDSDL